MNINGVSRLKCQNRSVLPTLQAKCFMVTATLFLLCWYHYAILTFLAYVTPLLFVTASMLDNLENFIEFET